MTTKEASVLAQDFLEQKEINFIPSIEWGLTHEKKALEAYKRLHDVHVFQPGLLVSRYQPWLCASIDGAVVEDDIVTKIIEIKCPSSCKNETICDEKPGKFNVGYLKLIGDTIMLKESHMYYTQCQIGMYVTRSLRLRLIYMVSKGRDNSRCS